MTSTFIIAEAGSSHDNDLQKAYRLIEAAKECGADAVKFQWTSDSLKMAARRGFSDGKTLFMYGKYLHKPVEWLHQLKAHCDKVGIEFMCTVYLIEDIATIAPLVKRFKVSAFEATWEEFVDAHGRDKEVIISVNEDVYRTPWMGHKLLHCISEYPTPIEHLHLAGLKRMVHGLSDHTANVLTGAAAVAAGAKIIEAHIRLHDTDKGNPDYGHSLIADKYTYKEEHGGDEPWEITTRGEFAQYVNNIRTVERML